MYRLFTAIDIPDDILDYICSFQKKMPSLKWCRKEQMHLTLNFIGNADEKLFLKIKKELASLTYDKLKISLGGTGFFPGTKNPSIFWLDIKQSSELGNLQKKIENILSGLGIKPEAREFKAHLTLLRIKDRNFLNVEKLSALYSAFEIKSFIPEAFVLYSSKLTPNGPIYTKEASYSNKNIHFDEL